MALLYHEPQVAALCAVHCLNTLLQGPYFTEVDLAQIAQELDAQERALLEGISTEEAGNVDASGMFSSQVLSQALSVWNLTITPITSPDMQGVAENPQHEQAFICNLQEHWFTVRRMGTDWYNFNSIYPAPEALGTFYLAAFLASLREQGYTIFVVRGQLPREMPPTNNAPGRWFTPDEAKGAQETAAQTRQRGRVNNAIEEAFGRAQAAGGTMQLRSRGAVQQEAEWEDEGAGDMHDDADADLAAAIAASLQGTAASPDVGLGAAGPAAVQPEFDYHGAADEDADLAAAIAASLQDSAAQPQHSGPAVVQPQHSGPAVVHPKISGHAVSGAAGGVGYQAARTSTAESQPEQVPVEPLEPEPGAGEGVIELAFRLPSGTRALRRFNVSSPTSQLYRYLEADHHLKSGSFQVFLSFPRKAVPRSSSDSLQATGLENRSMLGVEVQR